MLLRLIYIPINPGETSSSGFYKIKLIVMSSYFDKLSEYYKSDQADKDKKRFEKQAKNTFISTAIILGVVLLLIVVIVIIMGIQSVFG